MRQTTSELLKLRYRDKFDSECRALSEVGSCCSKFHGVDPSPTIGTVLPRYIGIVALGQISSKYFDLEHFRGISTFALGIFVFNFCCSHFLHEWKLPNSARQNIKTINWVDNGKTVVNFDISLLQKA